MIEKIRCHHVDGEFCDICLPPPSQAQFKSYAQSQSELYGHLKNRIDGLKDGLKSCLDRLSIIERNHAILAQEFRSRTQLGVPSNYLTQKIYSIADENAILRKRLEAAKKEISQLEAFVNVDVHCSAIIDTLLSIESLLSVEFLFKPQETKKGA